MKTEKKGNMGKWVKEGKLKGGKRVMGKYRGRRRSGVGGGGGGSKKGRKGSKMIKDINTGK